MSEYRKTTKDSSLKWGLGSWSVGCDLYYCMETHQNEISFQIWHLTLLVTLLKKKIVFYRCSGWTNLLRTRPAQGAATVMPGGEAGNFLFTGFTYFKWFYTSCDFSSCSERKRLYLTPLKCNACVFGGGEGGAKPLRFSWTNKLHVLPSSFCDCLSESRCQAS